MPTESQLRDPALRALIARSIDEGRLPLILTKTIGVGFGSGAECVAWTDDHERADRIPRLWAELQSGATPALGLPCPLAA